MSNWRDRTDKDAELKGSRKSREELQKLYGTHPVQNIQSGMNLKKILSTTVSAIGLTFLLYTAAYFNSKSHIMDVERQKGAKSAVTYAAGLVDRHEQSSIYTKLFSFPGKAAAETFLSQNKIYQVHDNNLDDIMKDK